MTAQQAPLPVPFLDHLAGCDWCQHGVYCFPGYQLLEAAATDQKLDDMVQDLLDRLQAAN